MSEIYTPNVVKVEMIYTQLTQRVQNVYHVSKGSPATLADLQALWTIFRDWEQNSARTSRSNSVSLVLITLTAMDSAGAPFHEAAVSPAIVGAITGAGLPPIVSLAIKHTTGKSGRSFRGRTYWIGMYQSALATLETISSASAAVFAGYYNTLRTTLATAGWQFGVVSRYSGVQVVGGYRRAIPRAQGIFTAITASSCETGVDSQRHRKLPYQV